MFEHFEKPEELFAYRLGAALTMEQDSLEMLAELEEAAPSEDVKEMFRHHAAETRDQIDNLREVFRVLGLDIVKEPSPTTRELADEGRDLLAKAGETLRDDVAVAAALRTEHHEISAYQSLVATARTKYPAQVVHLLAANLEQEQHTSDELTAKAKELAAAT